MSPACICRSTVRISCAPTGLHCISHWQLATVPPDYKGRVFLIPNSLVPQARLPATRVAELRAELGAGPGDFLIGSAGRLAASKGFDVLLRAFARARCRVRGSSSSATAANGRGSSGWPATA
jgi:glycosyltransferase involved in cell wall biosynthesis